MSQLLQKRASDYSVKRVPKFNLDPMFGVNECRDKALRPIYSGLKRKNPSENIEKQAMRSEDKHLIAARFGVEPLGAWKTVVRDLRDKRGKPLADEEAKIVLRKHMKVKPDSYHALKNVKPNDWRHDAPFTQTREISAIIDKNGDIVPGTEVAGDMNKTTSKREKAGDIVFHSHPHVLPSLLNLSKNRRDIEKSMQRHDSALISDASAKSIKAAIIENLTDEDIAKSTNLASFSPVGRTRPSGLSMFSYLKSKQQLRDDLRRSFKHSTRQYSEGEDYLPLKRSRELARAIEGAKFSRGSSMSFGKSFNDMKTAVGWAQEDGRQVLPIANFDDNKLGTHTVKPILVSKDNRGGKQAPEAFHVTSKFFDMGNDKSHKEKEQKIRDLLRRSRKDD